MLRILLLVLVTAATLATWLVLMLPVHGVRAIRRLFSGRRAPA
ncbi:hypothetical protein [Methylobacterium sp. J-026]|nr:hypothetical protein [Methylobacterium sp. J-026]